MVKTFKYKFNIPIALVVGIFVFTIISCRKSDLDKVQQINVEKIADERSENVNFIYTEDGIIKFKLFAPVIEKYTKDSVYTEFPKGVEAFFYDSLGNQTSHLTSNYAVELDEDRITQQKKQIFLKDSVVFSNYKGEILETERLFVRNDSVFSDTAVKITTPKMIIHGQEMEADQKFTYYKIKKTTGFVFLKDSTQNKQP